MKEELGVWVWVGLWVCAGAGAGLGSGAVPGLDVRIASGLDADARTCGCRDGRPDLDAVVPAGASPCGGVDAGIVRWADIVSCVGIVRCADIVITADRGVPVLL
ncbi:hypothetical protein ABZ734_17965 [Streptomyces sp. NPDC006660]|uniref:hypothetical protein n=1 Tax=Streptomyces sp. NPDC006660 TaxID=3156901 RepID=UPI0033CBC4A2